MCMKAAHATAISRAPEASTIRSAPSMAGDLPNIHADASGNVLSEVLSPFLTLSKEAEDTLFDADGSSIVIFEKADDYETDPDGGAGKPIGCGKVVTKP